MWNETTFLATVKSQITENLIMVKDNFSSLTEEELNEAPSKKSWSIGQCLKHIILFDEKYMEQISKALEEQDLESQNKLFRMSLNGRLFMQLVKPNGKIKAKTVKPFVPTKRNVKEGILDAFERRQANLMELIIECEGKDLRGIKVTSPLTSLLRFRLGEILSLIAMHQRRHINQALRVKEEIKKS